MRQVSMKLPVIMLCVLILVDAIFPNDALARAGGGGGGSGSGGGAGGIVNLIVLPLCIAYSLFVSYLIVRKNRQSKQALLKAAADSFWDPDSIKSRIMTVFHRVQEAWTTRDQTIAQSCMSERLFQDHKRQTDLMISNRTQNVLERISLTRARIVEVLDYQNDSQDQFWAYIEGSMIDYTVDGSTGKVIKGRRDKPESFTELWKFVRADHGWVLDEIDQSVQITDLLGMKSFTES